MDFILTRWLTPENTILNSFLASGDFCHLLIFFANSLELDQDRQNASPDLYPNCLTPLIVFLKDLLEKSFFNKVSRRKQKHEKLPSMQVDKIPLDKKKYHPTTLKMEIDWSS